MDFRDMSDFLDRLTGWRIPGNVMQIYKDGKPVYTHTSGYSELETGEKMTEDKLFYLYSCSKITTTLAGMQLYEKGEFLLDTPISEFLPAFRTMQVRQPDGSVRPAKKPITMRHLFTMTAGFNYDTGRENFKSAEVSTGGRYDTIPTINCLAEKPLDFEPGAHWQYSLCHDVLAAVIEVISGMKFRDYVGKHIFAPLGMDATFAVTDEVKARMAMQYTFVDDSGVTDAVARQKTDLSRVGGHIVRHGLTNQFVFGPAYDSGGAGIVTSVPGYAKLMGALANGGISAEGERILSRSTIDLWRTDQLNAVQHVDFDWPQFVGYGYGLGVRTMLSRAVSGSAGPAGEFGWNGAAGGGALIDPENNVAFFYAHHMLNNQEAYVQPRLRNVLYACLEK